MIFGGEMVGYDKHIFFSNTKRIDFFTAIDVACQRRTDAVMRLFVHFQDICNDF